MNRELPGFFSLKYHISVKLSLWHLNVLIVDLEIVKYNQLALYKIKEKDKHVGLNL